MYNTSIATKHLSFGFGGQKAKVLNNVNLHVEKGSIYGFLGPNGAGKTTTIRLLLGLLPITNQEIKIFENPLARHRTDIFGRIGAFIESPSLYEHLSGYENLEITRKLKGVNKARSAEVLHEVGLTSAAQLKVCKYSLGMKQRLGLALALLSRPELLILDEPTNGLDPNGINEIRELLLYLNRQLGTTIFISSHLLSEIEKMATHLGIIHKGELVYQGTIKDLSYADDTATILQIKTNNNTRAEAVLKTHFSILLARNGILEIKVKSNEQIDEVNKLLVNNNIRILQLQNSSNNLENFYLSITQQ